MCSATFSCHAAAASCSRPQPGAAAGTGTGYVYHAILEIGTATPPGAGKTPQVIGRCAKGEYFGEIALLTDRRRACTVKAVGPTKVLSLQRKTFTRVMGPLQELLKRNMGAYNSYMLS